MPLRPLPRCLDSDASMPRGGCEAAAPGSVSCGWKPPATEAVLHVVRSFTEHGAQKRGAKSSWGAPGPPQGRRRMCLVRCSPAPSPAHPLFRRTHSSHRRRIRSQEVRATPSIQVRGGRLKWELWGDVLIKTESRVD